MTERDTPWPAGTPCWVDLMTSDIGAAQEFYGALFGWHLTAGGPETSGYVMADIDGRPVAGMGQQQEGDPSPPAWTTYLAADDAKATADAVTAAGGTVMAPPFDVMDAGIMAVVADPTGAVFGIWQAKEHSGARLVNATGALTWNEIMTRDYTAAKDFYTTVFAYTYTDMGMEGFDYSTIELNGETVGGIGGLPAEVPAQVPAHWRTWFAVEDTDKAVEAVTRLGGSIERPAEDMPYGRWSDVTDPQGARFAVIKPAQPA